MKATGIIKLHGILVAIAAVIFVIIGLVWFADQGSAIYVPGTTILMKKGLAITGFVILMGTLGLAGLSIGAEGAKIEQRQAEKEEAMEKEEKDAQRIKALQRELSDLRQEVWNRDKEGT